MIAALITEGGKLLHATTVRTATALIALSIPAIWGSMLLAAGTSDPQLTAKLGPLLEPAAGPVTSSPPLR